jgi:DNA repair protein RadA/Sms
MAKKRSVWLCQTCALELPAFENPCRNCGTWGSLVETIKEPPRTARSAPRAGTVGSGSSPRPLRAAAADRAERLPLGIAELDRVLGGGAVPGSIVLLGGEPGIGKSTLLLQAAAGVAAAGGRVLYATGEESAAQIADRADRLGLMSGPAAEAVEILAEHDAELIGEAARAGRPALLIVDSIQTATVDALDGVAGSVGQVRESAAVLAAAARETGAATILVGHVTKEGSIAGPKTLEHLVDAVITLDGDRHGALRTLRAAKNRFGSTEELGLLEMGEHGLEGIDDPGRAFLEERSGGAPGAIVAPLLEGSRPLLVEVQALVANAAFGSPRRTGRGLDTARLALLVAVLGRRAGIAIGDRDVYANLVGGIELDEPALDLPLALALASSQSDRPIPRGVVAVGEVGLLGELRPVAGLARRLREAARHGFTVAIVPTPRRGAPAEPAPEGLRVIAVATLREAINAALEAAPQR